MKNEMSHTFKRHIKENLVPCLVSKRYCNMMLFLFLAAWKMMVSCFNSTSLIHDRKDPHKYAKKGTHVFWSMLWTSIAIRAFAQSFVIPAGPTEQRPPAALEISWGWRHGFTSLGSPLKLYG